MDPLLPAAALDAFEAEQRRRFGSDARSFQRLDTEAGPALSVTLGDGLSVVDLVPGPADAWALDALLPFAEATERGAAEAAGEARWLDNLRELPAEEQAA